MVVVTVCASSAALQFQADLNENQKYRIAMPFSIRPHKEFLVRPSLPESLSRLAELANNLLWVWDYTVRGIFRRLDPAEWHNSHHNPVLMLGRLSQLTLEKASKDARFLAMYRKACERFGAYSARTQTKIKSSGGVRACPTRC